MGWPRLHPCSSGGGDLNHQDRWVDLDVEDVTPTILELGRQKGEVGVRGRWYDVSDDLVSIAC
jgi:hypothetical protein